MTSIKICGITELEHALCALDEGADELGFVLAASSRQVTAHRVAEIVEKCRLRFPVGARPWRVVGVFANQPLGVVQEAAAVGGLNVIQLSGRESDAFCRRIHQPLYRVVHVSELISIQGGTWPGDCVPESGMDRLMADLSAIRRRTGADRLLLDSGGVGKWGGTGQTFAWGAIGAAAKDCMVAGGLNPRNVASAIDTMRPWGVDTSSGVELNGRKDSALIRRFITEVRRIDE